MSPITARSFRLAPELRPLSAHVAAEPYPGVAALWERATLTRKTDPVFGIVALVVHEARRTPSEGAMAAMQSGRASWHWIVPAPHEAQHGRFIWSAAPEARGARHLPAGLSHPALARGRGALNHVTLGVLLAADPSCAGAAPSPWQTEALAALIRHLWARYPRLATVICRSEIDADCPAPRLDWPALWAETTRPGATDLPRLVAQATPLAFLDPPLAAEPALRTS